MARDRTPSRVRRRVAPSRGARVVWVGGRRVGARRAAARHAERASVRPRRRRRPFGASRARRAYWDAVWFLDDRRRRLRRRRARRVLPAVPAARARRRRAHRLGRSSAGSLVSLACLLGALVLLHRLVALDFGRERRAADRAARRGLPGRRCGSPRSTASRCSCCCRSARCTRRAPTAGRSAGVGGRARGATRSAGIVLLVPLAILWWQQRAGGRATSPWLALVPAGPRRVLRRAWRSIGQDALGAVPRAGGVGARRSPGRSARCPTAVERGVGRRAADPRRRATRRRGRSTTPRGSNVGAARRRSSPSLVALVGALRRLPLAYWALRRRRARAAAVATRSTASR